ncbi:MAG TPA: hypothetical protein VKQ32_26610 [Polyangia bacterium]|nr:hypothetical protein [Polyangia bacterium]
MKGSLFATSLLAAATVLGAAMPAHAAAEPKFYFQIKEVTAAPGVDAAVKTAAVDALKAELASRPEWASDVGVPSSASGPDRAALAAELTKRKLRGFDVTVRLETFKQEMKDPRPGGRLKQLAVNVKLVIIGATIPDEKMAFEGNGEALVEAEVAEKRMAADSANASKAALKSAIKQAVDEAVVKLGANPAAAPGGGKKPAKKKKA